MIRRASPSFSTTARLMADRLQDHGTVLPDGLPARPHVGVICWAVQSIMWGVSIWTILKTGSILAQDGSSNRLLQTRAQTAPCWVPRRCRSPRPSHSPQTDVVQKRPGCLPRTSRFRDLRRPRRDWPWINLRFPRGGHHDPACAPLAALATLPVEPVSATAASSNNPTQRFTVQRAREQRGHPPRLDC